MEKNYSILYIVRDFGMKKKINIKFVKVPAHSGVTYNEIADELAKAALKGEENE